ncbi:hypothetical protein ACJJTC_012606 [Scirpophaga incertulas]
MATFPILYSGQKYDIKQFLQDHPGGVNTLERYKGRSVQKAMETFGHSVSAYHMLCDFKVDTAFQSSLTGEVSANGRIVTAHDRNKQAEDIAFLEELESRIDWSKPLLAQLHKIATDYEMWVNSAVFRTCRLFQNPLLESLTYTPWYLVPVFWVPVILYLGVTQFLKNVFCEDRCPEDSLTVVQYCAHLLFGLVTWTVLEYSLHRWVFHLDPGSSLKMIQIHFLIHGLHHKMPFDSLRQVFPTCPSAGYN